MFNAQLQQDFIFLEFPSVDISLHAKEITEADNIHRNVAYVISQSSP